MRKILLFNLIYFGNLTAFTQPAICPQGNITLTSNLSGSTYQWQVKITDNYVNVNDNANYAGASASTLQISNVPSNWYGYQYRCIVDGVVGRRFTITFNASWIGALSADWETAGNWSCGAIPDSNTDVYISPAAPYAPEIHSNLVCRSIDIPEGASLTINPNNTILLTGKSKTLTEDLDDYEFSILDSLPLTYVPLSNIIMRNGLSVRTYLEQNDPGFLNSHPSSGRVSSINTKEKQLDLFLARLIAVGSVLVDDNNFRYETRIPPQTGLGYLPGGKQYLEPRNPSGYGVDCISDRFYGLDCSGMLYVMTTEAHLPPVVPRDDFSVAAVSETDKWDKAFKNSEYDSLGMFDKGRLPLAEIQMGDIIIWRSHIGVCLNNSIYQSYGRFSFPECQTNYSDANRGPRILPLTQNWLDEFGVYTIFRTEFNTFTDPRDGRIYSIKQIGKKTWMTENLRATDYNDGGAIPYITDNTTWYNYGNSGRDAWCYNDNIVSTDNLYGKLYNWHAVNSGRLAPVGWHVPSKDEWQGFFDNLGGNNLAGGKMKATSLWNNPNIAATNSSGFTAYPSGGRDNHGDFNGIGESGRWWSTTESTSEPTWAWEFEISNLSGSITFSEGAKSPGFAVRCVKD